MSPPTAFRAITFPWELCAGLKLVRFDTALEQAVRRAGIEKLLADVWETDEQYTDGPLAEAD